MDYTGVISGRSIYHNNVLNERGPFKCYVVISTCASTRRMVLDLVPDGSTETFISSLRNSSQEEAAQLKFYQTMEVYF